MAGTVSIQWTTDKQATSLVRYGVAPNLDQVTAETDVAFTESSHSVVLSGLKAGKMYLFQVQSRIGKGADGTTPGRDGMGNAVLNGYAFTADGSFVAA